MGIEAFALMNIESRWGKIQRKGIHKKLSKIMGSNADDLTLGDYWARRCYRQRVPDAFKICQFCKTVIIFEVEDSNPMRKDKLLDYGTIAWDFDADDEWRFQIITTDRYGSIDTVIPMVPLMYYELSEDIKRKNI